MGVSLWYTLLIVRHDTLFRRVMLVRVLPAVCHSSKKTAGGALQTCFIWSIQWANIALGISNSTLWL